MSIEDKEFTLEKTNLENANRWLSEELISIEEEKEKQKENISKIRKESKTYNVELEIAKQRYSKISKDYDTYVEAKKIPYFARIDFKEERGEINNYYIGKFGIYDKREEKELIIDWRAPIADLYYSATKGQVSYTAPIGEINGELLLKRKLLVKEGKLIDAFDEGINDIILKMGEEIEGNSLIDEFLKINLEQSLSSKLKDIVATIQREQNEIIRGEIKRPTIVQGSAGSGKTTIALHRLAYILYRYKNKIEGKDILVVAPNRLFLDYISDVLPSLGVGEVTQTTFEDFALNLLKMKVKLISKDEKLAYLLEAKDLEKKKLLFNSSKLKGDKTYKTILDRYVLYIEKLDLNIQDIKLDEYALFEKNQIKRLYSKDLSHLPLNKRKQEIKRYCEGKVKEKSKVIEDSLEVKYANQINQVKRNMTDCEGRRNILIDLYDKRDKEIAEVKSKIKNAINEYFTQWINKDIFKLYHEMFKEIFYIITEGKIPQAFINYMEREIAENIKNKCIDADDLAALVYLHFKINGKEYNYKHIVIDEAQDYSLLQLEVLKQVSLNNSMTIVGDVGQGIYYYKGINDWNKAIKKVFENKVNYATVTQSYRSTVEIINFANKVLMKQENNLKPAEPVLRHGEEPKIININSDEDFIKELNYILKYLENKGRFNIAIIGKNKKECKDIYELLNKKYKGQWKLIGDNESEMTLGKIIIPSYMTKGLEFDCSIIYNCNAENYRNNELDKKILYVALTRALHFEYIFYKEKRSMLIDQ
ncbi:helicase IV [Clostridium homopropionicum DSM 5847]|uniref:Helicase IV n=1 Tax=Clostridium homopropionicum DSM 5847 TaxID=1121318 RepID=A0A0L6ZEF6_9CLOT|nr:RNA polymerase recycling motor HelD [Clostridium homopropionicum]KOA21356.1 helicase IV [Clostridium homopropionicum DSM 5847]SFG12498.1 DNA helicase-2 / ATP-dependent DNA helicase PcrA [Clostridium homopropionicum]